MSELFVLSRRRLPAIVPPLLSFIAGFIDSFTVLALFGLFVAQVTGRKIFFVGLPFGGLRRVAAMPPKAWISLHLLVSACFETFRAVYPSKMLTGR
jgi:uncharacterized membrane protein YoaK (UPF0700 family)